MLGTVIILAVILRGDTYFQYDDCDESCKQLKESCTITEISPDYFPIQCFKDEHKCAAVASDQEVCLRPNKTPLGGRDIWNDFHKHAIITTTTLEPTTTTERPIKPESIANYALSIILGIIATLSISLNLFLIFKRKLPINSRYETFTDSENPYRDTTEHLEED